MQTLNSEFDLIQLSPNDKELAVAFVLTNRDICTILQNCPRLKTVYVHPMTLEKMPCVGQTLMHMQKISVVADEDIVECPPKGNESGPHNHKEMLITAELRVP